MNVNTWQSLVENGSPLVASMVAAAVISQCATLVITARARANGATRAEARMHGRDAGLVSILAAVVLLAGSAALGYW